MLVLGINAFHGDSSACLVNDGKLVAAAEEERFRRIKHWAGFPSEAIRYCLSEAGIELNEVKHLAINHNPRAHLSRKLLYAIVKRPDFRLILNRIRNQARRASITTLLHRAFPERRFSGKVHYIEHHIAHLASAFLVSPFAEAVTASIDGFGDFSSAAWGVGCGTQINSDGRVFFPHSLGVFYQAMTQYLGFPHYGDEYKVMGLAPYGQPKFLPEMRRMVQLSKDGMFRLQLEYFRHHNSKFEYAWEDSAPHVGQLYGQSVEELLGRARAPDEPLSQHHRNVARSVQAMYEEAFFHMLNSFYDRYRIDAIALAGGCAMNSVANGKIYATTPFKHVYVQSAAGDAGGAIGAAMVVSCAIPGARRIGTMDHAYWGPAFDDRYIQNLLMRQKWELDDANCLVRRVDDEQLLCQETALAIADGKVIGWFQGRMEWGPRALGNRSILCDPRRHNMKEILNIKIKRRESFRPFAPSILREAVSEWFETDDDVPFMMEVFNFRKHKQSQVPAVAHVDGSGRLQTVHRDTNPRYYRLIELFYKLTGVPMVLNTSFNENEPVVCRPEEALDCFLRTKIDVLVLGNWMILRNPANE